MHRLNGLAGRPQGPISVAELEENIALIRWGWEKQQAELATMAPDPEYDAALAALEAREAALAERDPIVCDSEDVEASNAVYEAENAAEPEVFETIPTTRAGAVDLLRFVADFLDDLDVINDRTAEGVLPDSIRAAVRFFEGAA